MRPEDGYRILELDPAASDDEVKRACRDLTKVWHPDRFRDDSRLRQKAEEKLKTILAACEAIRASRAASAPKTRDRVERDTRDDGTQPGESQGEDAPRARRYGTRAVVAAAVAAFLLFRRPTPVGLAIAVVLFGLSAFFVARMRSAEREGHDRS